MSLLVLIVDARFSPKVRFLARWHMASESAINFMVLPFDIKIAVRRCKLPGSSGKQVVDVLTSDEACYEMVSLKRSW